MVEERDGRDSEDVHRIGECFSLQRREGAQRMGIGLVKGITEIYKVRSVFRNILQTILDI